MNRDIYMKAMKHLDCHSDAKNDLIARLEAGEQKKIFKIPAAVQRAAEIAAAAACITVIALFIFPLFQNSRIKLPHSSGEVSARVVKNPDLDTQTIPQPASLTEEEQFGRADTILSGTVEKEETIEITLGKDVSYRSLITVHTDYVWRGAESSGSDVKILLPYAVDEKDKDTDHVLAQIRTGMRGIFLMETYTKDSLYTDNDQTLALMDIAPYGLFDDSGAFLEQDGGVIYRAESFPGLKVNPTYDVVCGYVTAMVNNQPMVIPNSAACNGEASSGTSAASTTASADHETTATASSKETANNGATNPANHSGNNSTTVQENGTTNNHLTTTSTYTTGADNNYDYKFDNTVIVYIKHEYSRLGRTFTIDDFKEVDPASVEDHSPTTYDDDFCNVVSIKLKTSDRETIIKDTELLKQREDIEYARPEIICDI